MVDFTAKTLTSFCSTQRQHHAHEVKKLFKPYGWTGSRPEKWGALADPRGEHHDRLPWTLIGITDGIVVASASLLKRDYDEMDCGPWLAGVVVHPDYRHRGLASFLIRDIELHAAALYRDGHPCVRKGKIYLNAERTINDFDSVDMYTRRGWKFYSNADEHKMENIIMFKSLV